MQVTFSDDDEGKRVVRGDDEVGRVVRVDHGTAYVDPDPGMTDTLKAKLGWGDQTDDAYPLQEEDVERVDDDEIRLKTGA